MTSTALSGSEQWGQWLARLRMAGITLILIAQLATRMATPRPLPLLQLSFELIAVWYALALVHLALLKLNAPRILPWQLLLDAGMLAGLTYASGGITSLLSGAAPLLVIAAAAALSRRMLYLLAAFSVASNSLFTLLAWRHWIPAPWAAAPTHGVLALSLLLHLLATLTAVAVGTLLITQIAAADRQIAQQRAISETLRALNTNIIRSMRSGLMTTDLEGLIYLANPTAETILERPSPALIGHRLSDILPIAAMDSIGQRAEFTLRFDEREKVIGISANPLQADDHGRVGWILNFRDLTQLRHLEREVQARERMSALGRMAASIAHEIRNPLAAIAGSVSLLGSFGQVDEDGRRLISIVRDESQRLNRTLNDFLAYARDYQYRWEPVDLRQLLQELEPLLRQHPLAAGAELRLELGSLPIPLLGDNDRLRQVFWNLAANAFKAMAGTGLLTVRARPSAAGIRLEFSDTGPGVPPEDAERIFEPFHSGFAGGTGLGLATCYSIIEAHGGKLWVEPAATGGACFVLQLPLAAPAISAAPHS